MKCSEVQNLLHMEPEGSYPAPVRAHLERCRPCQQVHDDLQVMRGSLRGLPAPGLPDGFELELRRRLAGEAHPEVKRRPASRVRLVPLAIAMAATLLLVLGGLVLWRQQRAGHEPTVQPGAVAINTVSHHRLHLAVHAVQAHGEALFDVELPENAALAGGLESELGGGRVVRWRSDLLPGVNEIDLPVVLSQKEPHPVEVRARLIASGKVYTTRVKLTPTASGMLGHESAVRLAWVLDTATMAGQGGAVQ